MASNGITFKPRKLIGQLVQKLKTEGHTRRYPDSTQTPWQSHDSLLFLKKWSRVQIVNSCSKEKIHIQFTPCLNVAAKLCLNEECRFLGCVNRHFKESVNTKTTRPHNPENGILHSRCREDLKSYIV
jgi:hypothetical protein